MTEPGPVAEQSFIPEDLSDSKSPLGTIDVSIDGERNCQYKRHAEGSPGALYCGEESHDCKFYARGEENEEICEDLSTSDVKFTHQAFVTCEWASNANPAPTLPAPSLPTKALDIIRKSFCNDPWVLFGWVLAAETRCLHKTAEARWTIFLLIELAFAFAAPPVVLLI
jgi:hypothetical protein